MLAVGSLLSSCGTDGPSALEAQFRSQAAKLSIRVKSAADLADGDRNEAMERLAQLCSEAGAFEESIYGPNGFEYPGDIKDPTETAWYTPGLACHLHDALQDGAMASFANYYAELTDGIDCLWATSSDRSEKCAVFGPTG